MADSAASSASGRVEDGLYIGRLDAYRDTKNQQKSLSVSRGGISLCVGTRSMSEREKNGESEEE